MSTSARFCVGCHASTEKRLSSLYDVELFPTLMKGPFRRNNNGRPEVLCSRDGELTAAFHHAEIEREREGCC